MASREFVKRLLGRWLRFRPAWQPAPSVWGLEMAPDLGLSLDGVSLAALTERFGSPLHVVDFAALACNAAAVSAAESPGGLYAQLFYSYKTNPVAGVLARLHALGAGAEVISAYELWLAMELGLPGERIIYNGPVKDDASLEQAVRADVACINANSRHELERIASIATRLGRVANVGLRLSVAGGWQGQFGFVPGIPATEAAIAWCRDHPALALVGLHCHRGHAIRDADTLRGFVAAVMTEHRRIEADHNVRLPMIDLGGSLACPTTGPIGRLAHRLNRTFGTELPAPAPALSVGDYARIALAEVERHAPETPPAVVLEPGRGITSNSQCLLTTVVDLKASPDGFEYAVLDAGINLAEAMRSELHAVFVASGGRAGLGRYRLVGPICTPGDVLRYSVTLPKLAVGDRLAIMDAGAYFIPFSTSFSFPQPAVVGVENGVATLLRRAETFDDLLARDLTIGEPAWPMRTA